MKVLKILLIVFLILTATVSGAVLRIREFMHSTPVILPPVRTENKTVVPELEQDNTEPEETVLNKVNVLLVGLDDLEGVNRSDSLALAVFDGGNKSVRMLSIPRDSRVQIPKRGWQKINHAYAYGGIELLKETVKNFLGVEIDYFLVLGFQSFPRVIDLLGGIDIDVEKKLVYKDRSQKLFINIPKGQQHMNGKTALEYVRFRHDPLGDIGRVQRQQKFISVVMEKLKSPLIIPKIPSLVGELLSSVNTDLPLMETLRLAQFANSLPSERVKLLMAPGKAAYVENLSYWLVDLPAAQKWLNSEIADTFVADAGSAESDLVLSQDDIRDLVSQIGKIGILNGDGGSGLGKKASRIFQKLGIDVAYTGNAKRFGLETSNVVYPEDATESDKQAADALAKLCGITDRAQETGTTSMVSVILGRDKDNVFKRLEAANF